MAIFRTSSFRLLAIRGTKYVRTYRTHDELPDTSSPTSRTLKTRLTASLQTTDFLRDATRSVPVRASSPVRSVPVRAFSGFTLIETALALLAIGLGLLALFGLGRLGLTTSKESENDTRCAQMADAVFETLREVNTRFVDNARTNTTSASWPQQWQTVKTTSKQIPFPRIANMSASDQLYLQINTGKLEPAYDENALSLTDWNPYYELVVNEGDSSYVSGTVNLQEVTLAIYPDGDTPSSAPRLYHTTLSNPGGMP